MKRKIILAAFALLALSGVARAETKEISHATCRVWVPTNNVLENALPKLTSILIAKGYKPVKLDAKSAPLAKNGDLAFELNINMRQENKTIFGYEVPYMSGVGYEGVVKISEVVDVTKDVVSAVYVKVHAGWVKGDTVSLVPMIEEVAPCKIK